jgi:hypothetical protein
MVPTESAGRDASMALPPTTALAALRVPNAIRPTATPRHRLAFIECSLVFQCTYPLALARVPKGKRARGSIPSQWVAIGLNPVAASPPGPTHRKRRKGLGCLVICRFAGRVRPYRVRASSEHPASNASQNVSLPAISLPNSRRPGAPSFGAPLCLAYALSARADLYFPDIGLSTARRRPWLTTNC